MTDGPEPRAWRNPLRSRRALELRRDLTAPAEDLDPTDWWIEDDAAAT
ncbi:hypothetical protein [Curtobacterium sp. MCBA15_004]|nr:hypothetical protein [Curtobacterium sp. MCBA15_004]WIA97650.1 hypothetical protein QOL16_04445 [Curtobacterium sp. MCBA15_004]